MRLPRISRRKFLQGAVLAGTAATCPGLLSGCSIARSCRTPLPDVSEVSLQQKIAQMLIVGFRAMELKGDEPIVRDIRDLGIGGVILFDWDDILKTYDRDIASPQQVVRLTTTLNSYARLPLLISIDQEGGKVCRLKERYGFPSTVSAQTLGSSSDLSRTPAIRFTAPARFLQKGFLIRCRFLKKTIICPTLMRSRPIF